MKNIIKFINMQQEEDKQEIQHKPKMILLSSGNDNENIMLYDDTFILGKSNLESDAFDVLIFARRDVKTPTIPPFVKIISAYAFERCTKLETFTIPEVSQLEHIGNFAFAYSTIKSFTIPPHLKSIGIGAFL